MNKSSARSAMLGIAVWTSLTVAQAATPASPVTQVAPAASAASAVAPGLTPRARPQVSPAVRAAQGAVPPGDLRPENPVVPQIAVPLRRPRDAAGSAVPGAMDDSAARCRAATSDRERAACIRSGSVSGTAPKR